MTRIAIPIVKLQYEKHSKTFSINKQDLDKLGGPMLIDTDHVFEIVGMTKSVDFHFSSSTLDSQFFRPKNEYHEMMLIINYIINYDTTLDME